MKKSLLLLMSLIIYGTLSAQTKNQNKTSQLYEINPVGNDQLDWHLKFGGEFKFKITHVNAIKLSGYTTSKPFTFEADAPSVFFGIFKCNNPKGCGRCRQNIEGWEI